MINRSVVEGLEDQREQAKELIARGDLAAKLANNRDFRKLILEGFCRDDAARLVSESGDPALDPQQRSDAMAMAQAGGHLKRYLRAAMQMGEVARKELGDIEEALDEERANDAQNDTQDDSE